jgi:hypothetical protein
MGDLTTIPDGYYTNIGNSYTTITASNGGTRSSYFDADYILRNYQQQKVDVAVMIDSSHHKYLNEDDFKDQIKSQLSHETAKELVKRMQFTKSENHTEFTTRFRGRAWVFTDEEMKQFIKDIKNA